MTFGGPALVGAAVYGFTGNHYLALAGASGAGGMVYGLRAFLAGGEAQSDPVVKLGSQLSAEERMREESQTYKVLAQLWASSKIEEFEFKELSSLWRNPGQKEEKKRRVPVFKHKEITRFYNIVRPKPFFVGDAIEVIIDVLEFLDAHGDCPSVVEVKAGRYNSKEMEPTAFDPDSYEILARIPLYRHSLRVAYEVLDRIETAMVGPRAVIAALCHDLGKIPFYYGRFYKGTTHPMVSIAIMEDMPGLRGLKWYEEIAEAVQNHHIQTDPYLDHLLRECDKAARRSELLPPTPQVVTEPPEPPEPSVEAETAEETPAEMLAEALAELSAVEEAPTGAIEPAAMVEPQPEEPATSPVEMEQEDAAPVQEAAGQVEERRPEHRDPPPLSAAPMNSLVEQSGKSERSERKRVPRQLVDISQWFQPEAFITELTASINVTLAGERYWSCLELNGYVYLKPSSLWLMLLAHSKSDPDVIAAGASEQFKDDYMYSVIAQLKKEQGLVATEFLRDEKQFGSVFLHNGTSKMFLIPFRGAYFGADELIRAERRRNTLMKKTTALVPMNKKGAN